MEFLDDYRKLVLDTDWRPPRPSRMRGFRQGLVEHLTTPPSVAMIATAARRLTVEPIKKADHAVQFAEGFAHQMQGDLRHAALYHVDARTSMESAAYAQQRQTTSLIPELVPAAHGLAIFVWPVLFDVKSTPRTAVVGISWAPTRDRRLPDGGVDVTFWAPPTREIVRHFSDTLMSSGYRVSTTSQWQQQVGPLVLLNQAAWGYGLDRRAAKAGSLGGWLRALHGLWLGISRTDEVAVEGIRASRFGFRRPTLMADTPAHRVRWVGPNKQ